MSAEGSKVAIALACREAMRNYRKGKPIAFSWPTRLQHNERGDSGTASRRK